MADIENSPTAASTTAVTVTPTEIPLAQGSFGNPIIGAEGVCTRSEVATEANHSNDLGTSPTQEKSSNSHPHDSEYDTASDLEGNEEYDDDDDIESLSEGDDDEGETDDETDTENDEDDDDEGVDIDLQGPEKLDADAQKKVDEDRSNPQYIPKRGTFYEHDDRTAELEEGISGEGQEASESPVVITGGTGSVNGSKTSTTPTISAASKTMKKWQPASTVDRWSHDRFDASEQAPKSRSELVNAYGYDIRTEDAPPKARRRRRYGRGPSKYNRNWEDESAYLKNNNKERKPPKPSEFPALTDKIFKPRRIRRTREEKENRIEKRKREGKVVEVRTEKTDKVVSSSRNNHIDDNDNRAEPRSDKTERNNEGGFKQQTRQKSFNSRGQGQNQVSVGRQAAMEFKQKNRSNYQHPTTGSSHQNSSSLSSRLDAQRQPQQNQQQLEQQQNIKKTSNGSENLKERNQLIPIQKQQQSQIESYNNKKKHLEQGYQPIQGTQQQISLPQQQIHQQQSQQPTMLNHSTNRQNSQIQKTFQQPSSNLSQRLQQVQNRNDPSHVGSVQMHSLATQNQQQQQQQQIMQQQTSNIIMAGQTQQQQQPQNQNISQQPMEQRGPPKRYSSLRRSQHDAQHIADHQQQQQLQQIHIQQQQQQSQAPPSMMMAPDQAMIQANLMQMYHQENLQAQIQALQVTQQPAVSKQPNYVSQGPQAPPQQPYSGNTPTPAAYYVASPDAYTAAATAAVTAQATQAVATYAAQQANPNFLAQQQTAAAAATLVYNTPNNAPQAVTSATGYGPSGQVGVVTQPQTGSTASGGYQNYNTVGGTTYFVPPPTQASSRPVSLPQRRPTNAIPILPPSEKNKQQKSQDSKADDSKSLTNQLSNSCQPPIGSAEDIDHIIDNMFMQRPAFQPPPPLVTTKTSATSKSTASLPEVGISALDNSNIDNSSPQDNTTLTTENIKSNNENSTAATAATSTVANTITTITTESSNNNQISAQE